MKKYVFFFTIFLNQFYSVTYATRPILFHGETGWTGSVTLKTQSPIDLSKNQIEFMLEPISVQITSVWGLNGPASLEKKAEKFILRAPVNWSGSSLIAEPGTTFSFASSTDDYHIKSVKISPLTKESNTQQQPSSAQSRKKNWPSNGTRLSGRVSINVFFCEGESF